VRHRDLIVTLAAKHKLPAIDFERFFAAAGGLASYGPDNVWRFGAHVSAFDPKRTWGPSSRPANDPRDY
jgi:hypothetical protein